MAGEFDVVVVGGGLAGCMAAWAAAENGARPLLLEHYGFLGGMATAGGVSPFMKFATPTEQLVVGRFQRFIDAMVAVGGMTPGSRAFDQEAMKVILPRLLLSAGVTLRLHSQLVGCDVHEGRISAVRIFGKEGERAIKASCFVDTSGDGDLAAMAGVPFQVGRAEDGLTQAMTMIFRIANVDLAGAISWARERPPATFMFIEEHPVVSIAGYQDLVAEAREREGYAVPQDYVFYCSTPHPREVIVNTTRVLRASGLSTEDLTRAEIEGREQAWAVWSLLKRHAGGFADSYLCQTAPQIGVRDTRRIVGEYVCTGEDIVGARKFPDVVARGCYPIDIHSPTDTGGVWKTLPPGESYDVPYRALVPMAIDNLLVAGKCLSASHEAQAALRIMATSAATGEAAGLAAALSASEGISPRLLEVARLQALLRRQGANLGSPV